MKTHFPAALAAAFLLACSSSGPDSIGAQRTQLGPGGSISSPGAQSSSGGSSSGSSGGGSSSGSVLSSGGSSSGVSGGGSSGASSSSSSGGGSSSGDAGATSDLQHCVDVINSYRATLSGTTPYAESSALEQFAALDAQSDSQTGQAHGRFISTNGGDGVAFAENEIPGWPLDQYGSVRDVIDQGLQMMWAEGPGGGHYENMASTQYTQAGCGIATTSDGSVWIAMDFQ